MPLILPSEVNTMLNTGSVEAYTTLDVIFGDDTPIHVSTHNITGVVTNNYGTVSYTNDLRVASTLNQTLTTSVDRVDLAVQNIDLILGNLITTTPHILNGANAVLGVVFISGATKKQVEILHGQISNASSEDMDVRFQLVSYLSLSGPVGGWRPLMRHCAWRFKRDGCNSPDPSTTCSHLFEDANGCSSKDPAVRIDTPPAANNQDSFGGFIFRSTVIVGSGIADPQGAMDGGNDFNTYEKNRGGWEGRHVLPVEHYPVIP